ncbi:MAG: molybdopterin-dependent oxidoreductase, partial [bacterium]
MAETINLTIDGKEVSCEKGCTVLEAARSAGIYIPTMCAHEALPDYGACRMCIVQIEGVRGFPTSCTTPAEDGMKVVTETEEIRSLRSRVLELMMSGHPNACLSCPHRSDCEKYRPRPTKAGRTTRCAFCSNRETCRLRSMTLELMGEELNLQSMYYNEKVERSDPFMDRDLNLCILCGRCWRICEKIHGTPAISIVNRGKEAKIGTSFGRSYVDAGCTFCGACVDICPTGSLSDRYAKWYGEPDEQWSSACIICPEGCAVWTSTEDKKIVANHMTSFDREARLCAIGRFAYPQIVNSPDRLVRPYVKEEGELISASWDDALTRVSEALKDYKGEQFAVIAAEASEREVKYLYQRLAEEVMEGRFGKVKADGTIHDLVPPDLYKDLESGKVKAAIVAGDYLTPDMIEMLDYLVVIDFLPSKAAGVADTVLPAAVLSETGGTFKNHEGNLRPISAASAPPGEARPEWRIISELARALGAAGFDYSNVHEITPEIKDDAKPERPGKAPRDFVREVPESFRGHYIADSVCALEAMGLPMSPVTPSEEEEAGQFPILEKEEIIPNFHLLKVEAPQVAKFAKPGQFCIVMAHETSERTPFTLVDWDAEAGTITLIVEEVGRSSREIAALNAGQRLAHVSGPLGTPFEIEKTGTVVLGGGCYGIGGIYPIARAMK